MYRISYKSISRDLFTFVVDAIIENYYYKLYIHKLWKVLSVKIHSSVIVIIKRFLFIILRNILFVYTTSCSDIGDLIHSINNGEYDQPLKWILISAMLFCVFLNFILLFHFSSFYFLCNKYDSTLVYWRILVELHLHAYFFLFKFLFAGKHRRKHIFLTVSS